MRAGCVSRAGADANATQNNRGKRREKESVVCRLEKRSLRLPLGVRGTNTAHREEKKRDNVTQSERFLRCQIPTIRNIRRDKTSARSARRARRQSSVQLSAGPAGSVSSSAESSSDGPVKSVNETDNGLLVRQLPVDAVQLDSEPARVPAVRSARPPQAGAAHHPHGPSMALVSGKSPINRLILLSLRFRKRRSQHLAREWPLFVHHACFGVIMFGRSCVVKGHRSVMNTRHASTNIPLLPLAVRRCFFLSLGIRE